MSSQNELRNQNKVISEEMHLDALSIRDFSAEVGSESPAPGGGSTAALAGLMAASLVIMVARISLNHSSSESDQEKLRIMISKTDRHREEFLQLINDDTKAFNKIYKSYKLPKNTDFEKKARNGAIQAATKHAAEVPLQTAKLGLETMELIDELALIGYSQTVSDIGVAGLMAYSAVLGACWNVKINLTSLKDHDFIEELNMVLQQILNKTNLLYLGIKEKVEQKI